MGTQLQLIREQQRESWNKIAAGWDKWDSMTMDFLQPMGDEIVRMIKPVGKDIVLDVAAGTGEPGLTIATMLDGGKVYITDIAEEMVDISRKNAANRGILNVEMVVSGVCELPFPDNTFDAISCRFGFMFFPDMEAAAREMTRVLKPGGRIATSVWNTADKNFWVTCIMSAIAGNIKLPVPMPGAPGMFRCAGTDLMSDLFSRAGLKNIIETEIYGKLNCGNAGGYWNFMSEVAGPVAAALGKVNDSIKLKIREEVIASIQQKYPVGPTAVDSNALVIYGEK